MKILYRKYAYVVFLSLVSFFESMAQSVITPPYEAKFENFITSQYNGLCNEGWLQESADGLHNITAEVPGDPSFGYVLRLSGEPCETTVVVYEVDATLNIDLSGDLDDILSFKWKSVITKSVNELINKDMLINRIDGIYFSGNNGNDYERVYSFYSTNNQWVNVSLNLKDLAEEYGLLLNSTFRIKIQYECWAGNESFIDPQSGNLLWRKVEKSLMLDNLKIETLSASTYTTYRYDPFGNRVKRELVTIDLSKSASISNSESEIEPTEEEFGDRKLLIYPNPTKGVISLAIIGGEEEDVYKYTLHNMAGTTLVTNQFVGNGQHPIDLSGFSNGNYLMVVENKQKRVVFKIIKE
jgi:hypothetical protein